MIKKIIQIDLFGKKGLENALRKLKLKEIKCSICKRKISKEQIASFFPMKKGGAKGKVGICCDKPSCFIGAVYEAKKFENG